MSHKTLKTSVLEVAYHEYGSEHGWPVILSHGFPYDVHAYDEVYPILVANGARVITPYTRGYGPTRFLSSSTMRSGQQAALGSDVISLLDGLGIKKAVLAGFDWGGLASCTATALWPERVEGLVSYGGYDIYNIAEQRKGFDPELECVMWYQHLFQGERGRECMAQHRKDLCKILWRQWSPTWRFTDEQFDQTAASFNNPDFVDVVMHCYRHCFGTEVGDPSLQSLEDQLAKKPQITVPTVTLDGGRDPLKPGGSIAHDAMFADKHERWAYSDIGHAFAHEAPEVFAKAIIKVHEWTS